jgi:hypothetical protein
MRIGNPAAGIFGSGSAANGLMCPMKPSLPNRAGRTMVWPLRGYLGLTIRCFMPGSMT